MNLKFLFTVVLQFSKSNQEKEKLGYNFTIGLVSNIDIFSYIYIYKDHKVKRSLNPYTYIKFVGDPIVAFYAKIKSKQAK